MKFFLAFSPSSFHSFLLDLKTDSTLFPHTLNLCLFKAREILQPYKTHKLIVHFSVLMQIDNGNHFNSFREGSSRQLQRQSLTPSVSILRLVYTTQ